MSSENWKPIAGYPAYEISNQGNVRSKNGVLKPWKLNTGYLQVKFHRKAQSVHRLVAMAFCAGWFDGAVVNHKNGLRDDNCAENLEWISSGENIRHGYRVLGAVAAFKGKFSAEHNTSKAVISTCLATGKEVYYPAGMDAVRDGFESSMISRCCHGRYKSHKGHAWRFAHAFGTQRGVEWSSTSLGRDQ